MGYGALPAFGLINRSKLETQGQLSRRGGAIRARLGLLFLGSRDMLFDEQVWDGVEKDYLYFHPDPKRKG